jgi:hypothetical protein
VAQRDALRLGAQSHVLFDLVEPLLDAVEQLDVLALRDEVGATVDAAPPGAPLACTGYFAWPALAFGRYTLDVEGFASPADGAPSWRADCWGLEVGTDAPDSYLCRVPRLP